MYYKKNRLRMLFFVVDILIGIFMVGMFLEYSIALSVGIFILILYFSIANFLHPISLKDDFRKYILTKK